MTAILAALRELGLGEVDIPVKDLDDATMIKIMANENMEDWETNTSVINETVLTVRDFLRSGAEKHVGATEILAFLGSGWAEKTVQQALATIRDKAVEKEAAEVFTTPTHAQTFRQELKKPLYKNLIPKEEQKEFAEEVKEEAVKINREGELTSSDIKRGVFNVMQRKSQASKKTLSAKVVHYQRYQ